MNAREQGLLMALERIDGPFGSRQTELRFARMAAAIAGALGGEAKIINHLPAWFQTQPDVMAAGRVPDDEETMRRNWNHVATTWTGKK
jgi:hypothetical protein